MESHFTVIIKEQNQCRLGTTLNDDGALTLFAVASEDPNTWADITACWARYRNPFVPEFADGLPLRVVDFALARQAIENTDAWLVLDLETKRIVAGSGLMQVGRDAVLTMGDEFAEERREWLVSIHLAPWWELHESAKAKVVDQPRQTPLIVPQTDRGFLFGRPLHVDLAQRMVAIFASEAWQSADAGKNLRARYPFTVRVHREWLMTPRSELSGQIPRQLLHGAHDWLERVITGQHHRIQPGQEIQAIPDSITGFDHAPMGNEELIIYFEMCRALIDRGWEWLVEQAAESVHSSSSPAKSLEQPLVKVLESYQRTWLNQADDEGEIPQRAIEYSRRRVPRVLGYQVSGMLELEPDAHVPDCDCPICEMLADGETGPVFVGFDGHHLELDNEFAFSMSETRDEWELNEGIYDDDDWDDQCDVDCDADCDGEHAAEHHHEQVRNVQVNRLDADRDSGNEFKSVWSSQVADSPIPGDSQGHLKLSFLLAEVIGILEQLDAPKSEIKRLNACFTEFRHSDVDNVRHHGSQLAQHLESMAKQHHQLVSRVADFQSRIADQVRLITG